ncbi:hypothetical protein ACFE04_015371 [Oxalis oulophora]
MTLQKLLDLEEGFRVIVDFEGLAAYGLAEGLLGAVCGLMATDYEYFPISFKSWHTVPDSYFDNAWKNIFEKIVPVDEYEKVFRETLQEEDEEEDDENENDESSGGSNGQ